jgi:hypothetical protein
LLGQDQNETSVEKLGSAQPKPAHRHPDPAVEVAVRNLQAVDDRIVGKRREPPCPCDHQHVPLDRNLKIALLDTG